MLIFLQALKQMITSQIKEVCPEGRPAPGRGRIACLTEGRSLGLWSSRDSDCQLTPPAAGLGDAPGRSSLILGGPPFYGAFQTRTARHQQAGIPKSSWALWLCHRKILEATENETHFHSPGSDRFPVSVCQTFISWRSVSTRKFPVTSPGSGPFIAKKTPAPQIRAGAGRPGCFSASCPL